LIKLGIDKDVSNGDVQTMLAAKGAALIAMIEFLPQTRPGHSVRSTTSIRETLADFGTLHHLNTAKPSL
jgi:hypothetical protein